MKNDIGDKLDKGIFEQEEKYSAYERVEKGNGNFVCR